MCVHCCQVHENKGTCHCQNMLTIGYMIFCRCCFPSQHQWWAGDHLRALQLPDPCWPQRRRCRSRTAASHRQVLLPRSVHSNGVCVVCIPLSLLDLKWNRTEGASCCLSTTIFVKGELNWRSITGPVDRSEMKKYMYISFSTFTLNFCSCLNIWIMCQNT